MADNDINIVTALNLVGNKMKLRTKTSEVIKAKDFKYNPDQKKVIGGDTKDFNHDSHPAIIIEKNGDQMSKIIVRCPCGRHSELVCEYEEDMGPVAEAQVGEADGTPEEASDDAPAEEQTDTASEESSEDAPPAE